MTVRDLVCWEHIWLVKRGMFLDLWKTQILSVVSALEIRFAPTEHALHRVKAELFGAKQMSGETFKQFAIRIQNAARHTDIPAWFG